MATLQEQLKETLEGTDFEIKEDSHEEEGNEKESDDESESGSFCVKNANGIWDGSDFVEEGGKTYSSKDSAMEALEKAKEVDNSAKVEEC